MGTDTVPPIPALAPNADVHGAEDLLVLEHVAGQPRAVVRADPELSQVGPELAVGQQQLDELRTEAAVGGDDPALRHGQRRRLDADPERRQARRDHRALSERRRDEALPARKVPERAPGAQLTVVGDRRRGRRARAADPCLADR